MTEIKGQPTDVELSDVDAKLLSPGWINLLDGAGLNFRERQVIGWALRIAPRLRKAQTRAAGTHEAAEKDGLGGASSPAHPLQTPCIGDERGRQRRPR